MNNYTPNDYKDDLRAYINYARSYAQQQRLDEERATRRQREESERLDFIRWATAAYEAKEPT